MTQRSSAFRLMFFVAVVVLSLMPAVSQAQDPCTQPGVTILTDDAGDIITPVGQTSNPGWDLRQLSIAEPFSFAPDKLVFTLKMESFAGGLPPANTRWPIQFRLQGGSTTTGYWVDMSTFATDGGSATAPAFKYGTFVLTPGVPPNPFAYGAPNTRLGDATGSSFNPNGTITIVVPRSAVGDPAVGTNLTGFLIRVRFGTDAGSVTPDNMPQDLAPAGSYTIVGNASCGGGNQPPVAADDSASTPENVAVDVNVLANDTDSNGDTLTVTGSTIPANGTATCTPAGVCTYTPNASFVGVDTFSYTADDGNGGTDTGLVTITVTGPLPMSCTPPGVVAATDPANDQNAAGTSNQDILSISFAEPASSFPNCGPGCFVVTMKVRDLQPTLPANGSWRVRWTAPDAIIYFVAMDTDAAGVPSYAYGTFAGNLYTELGAADGGTNSAASDEIQITILKSKVGNPSIGAVLTPVIGQTQAVVGVLLLTIDSTDAAGGSYTVVGNAGCSGAPPPVPAALAVDPAGNNVLEPGESVLVQPSWRNTDSVPLDLTGSAASFTGPVELTYTIVDGTADYGTIAAGATANCATATTGDDCYTLGLSAAATRPVAHWDGEFRELVSPGTTEKTWSMHIGDSFTDVPRSYLFYRQIETLLHSLITLGCGDGSQYCKNDPTSRLAMAVFIARAELGSDAAVPVSGTVNGNSYSCTAGGNSLFTDVAPTNQFCKHVHYIASQNITQGCTTTTYCPGQSVTRLQMAIFLARARAGSDAAVPTAFSNPANGRSYDLPNGQRAFTDLVGSQFEKHANYLWALGVTDGCTATTYCPSSLLTRGQMAKFLVGTYELLLYKP